MRENPTTPNNQLKSTGKTSRKVLEQIQKTKRLHCFLIKNKIYLKLVIFMLSFCRSSRREVFCKKDALKESRKFTGEHLRVSFLIKLRLRPKTLIKKRSWHRCSPVNFVKLLRTLLLQNTSGGYFCVRSFYSCLRNKLNARHFLYMSLKPQSIALFIY